MAKLHEMYFQHRVEMLESGGWSSVSAKVADIFLAGLDAKAKKEEDAWRVYFSNINKVHDAFMKKYSGKCNKAHGFMAGKEWQQGKGMFAEKMRHCMAQADVQATRSTLSWLKSKQGKCAGDNQCRMAYIKLKDTLERTLVMKKEKLQKVEKSTFFKSKLK